jgi:hypothetical protein
MVNIQRVKFINKEGLQMDLHLIIVKRKSKTILVKRPCDGVEFEIPRTASVEILDPERENETLISVI